MTTGQLRVDRRGVDSTELLSIRAGEWGYQKLVDEATRIDEQIQAITDSPLRMRPDHKAIDDLLYEIITA